jgi:hypothetical protein
LNSRAKASRDRYQRQLGHSTIPLTSVYLQGIDNAKSSNSPGAPRADVPGTDRVSPLSQPTIGAPSPKGALPLTVRESAA